MPFATANDGTRLWFEVFGNPSGPPVLLIQGLGADARGWTLQRRALGRRYRCIAFDNRGAGRSDKPAGPYDLETMAADAVAVLDAAGFESVAVMGASMGGVIAQILAVQYPERVDALVLACTACRHLPWRRELLADWARVARERGMGALGARSLRWLVGLRWHRRVSFPAQLLGSFVLRTPAHAFASQVGAILAMDDAIRGELARVRVPTLVIVGSQDILTPVGDSEEIADRIPGAELVVIRGAAHGLMVDHALAFNRTVCQFLADALPEPVPAAAPAAATA